MALVRALAALAAVGFVAAGSAAEPGRATGAVGCRASVVHTTAYPGDAPGLGRLPWVAGAPAGPRLVGLLWYWPAAWRKAGVSAARIWTHGHSPDGRVNAKILWIFLGTSAKRAYTGSSLVVKGTRLDGRGRTRQVFDPVSYAGQRGAPSFASSIALPSAGCWRLQLTAGRLKATVVLRAVSG